MLHPRGVVEKLVVDALVVLPAHTEADDAEDVVHDRGDILAHVPGVGIRQHRFVTARNIESDSGRADLVLIRHHSADGHGIPLVRIGHQRALVRRSGTILDLGEGAFVHRCCPDGNAVNYLHILFWTSGLIVRAPIFTSHARTVLSTIAARSKPGQ